MDGHGCHKATHFQNEPAANKPQGYLNQGPDWQPIGWKSHTKKATNWMFCYAFIGNFCSSWHIDRVSLWWQYPLLIFQTICDRGTGILLRLMFNRAEKVFLSKFYQRKKVKDSWKGRLSLVDLIEIWANYRVKHDLRKWIWLLWL